MDVTVPGIPGTGTGRRWPPGSLPLLPTAPQDSTVPDAWCVPAVPFVPALAWWPAVMVVVVGALTVGPLSEQAARASTSTLRPAPTAARPRSGRR